MKVNYSNPARFWVDNSKQKEFTYIGGQTPYNVHLRIDSCICLSVLVFADSKDQAKRIVLDMVVFGIECCNSRDVLDKIKLGSLEEIKNNADKIEVQQASRDQIYKIGWADNDTI